MSRIPNDLWSDETYGDTEQLEAESTAIVLVSGHYDGTQPNRSCEGEGSGN